MPIPIRPNPPGIMQCTSKLSPVRLFEAIKALIPSATLVNPKGRIAKDIVVDTRIMVVNDPTLTIYIHWRNNHGYTEYQMVCELRVKSVDVKPQYINIESYKLSVPDPIFVFGHVAECEERIQKRMNTLNPPVKKFVRKTYQKYQR